MREIGVTLRMLTDTRNFTRSEQEIMALLVKSFGANPNTLKKLEELLHRCIASNAKHLRSQGRLPRLPAELEREVIDLVNEAGRQRRAQARKWKTTRDIPTAQRIEYDGHVDIAGTVTAPSPDGYLFSKDLAHRAGLFDEAGYKLSKAARIRRKKLMEFFGRGLNDVVARIRVNGTLVTHNLGDIWTRVANRSAAVQRHMAQATAFMTKFEAKVLESLDLLEAAEAAERAGRAAEGQVLRARHRAAATEADRLRRTAKTSGDKAYNLVRNAFWDEVRSIPELANWLRDELGLALRDTGAPALLLEGGEREIVSLEHFVRRNDDPRLAVAVGNLEFSPLHENTMFLEAIRAEDARRGF